jgi:hypothetical protein
MVLQSTVAINVNVGTAMEEQRRTNELMNNYSDDDDITKCQSDKILYSNIVYVLVHNFSYPLGLS